MRAVDRIVCASVAVGALASVPLPAFAQGSYPNRAIRMIVPFASGGGPDVVARLLSESLAPALGTTIVADNRPGAGSVLGTDIVAKATPDGYTVLLGSISLAVNPAIYKKLPYDTLRDLAAVSLVAEQPNILLVQPALPARNLKELIAHVRANPGKLSFGSAGIGSGIHLATELMLVSMDGSMIHVPYKGGGPALTALMGNEITVYMSTLASALPHVKSGRLRALGVTPIKRVSLLPDMPTLDEAGIPGFDYTTWYGLMAPAATPRAIVDRLNTETVAQLNSATLQRRMEAQGLNAIPSTPAQFTTKLRSETEKWAKAAAAAKILPE